MLRFIKRCVVTIALFEMLWCYRACSAQSINVAMEHAAASITGEVIDAGTPVPGIQLEVLQSVETAGKRQLASRCMTTTDQGGRYTCGGLQAGEYYLVVRDPGALPEASSQQDHPHRAKFGLYYLTTNLADAETIRLTAGSAKMVDVGLGRVPTYNIRGRLRGSPRSPAISLYAQNGSSEKVDTGIEVSYGAADGTFSFDGVPPGQYAITANWHDEEAAHSIENTVVVSDRDVSGVELRGGETRLDLTVIPCDTGTAVVNDLALTRADGGLIDEANVLDATPLETDGNRFFFPPVRAGLYFVHPRASAGTFISANSLSGSAAGNAISIPDVSGTVTGSLKLNCQPSALDVTVIGGGDGGHSTSVVVLSVAAGERFVAVAPRNGSFTLGNLMPGTYQVYLLPEDADPYNYQFPRELAVSVEVGAGEHASAKISNSNYQ